MGDAARIHLAIVGLVIKATGITPRDDFVGREIIDPFEPRNDLIRYHPQDRFAVGRRYQHASILVGGNKWNRRNGQQQLDAWILIFELPKESQEIGFDVGNTKVDEFMPLGIEGTSYNARCERKHRTINLGAPCFGKTKREDQHISLREDRTNTGEMKASRLRHCLGRLKSIRLDLRPIGIDITSIRPKPGPFHRLSSFESFFEQLEQLSGGVKIAVAPGKNTEIPADALTFRQPFTILGNEVVKAYVLELPRNVLSEAASCRRDPGCPVKMEFRIDHRIEKMRLDPRHGSPPKLVALDVGIGICHQAASATTALTFS